MKVAEYEYCVLWNALGVAQQDFINPANMSTLVERFDRFEPDELELILRACRHRDFPEVRGVTREGHDVHERTFRTPEPQYLGA